MAQSFDLTGQRVDDPVFINARLHGPLFIGARLTDALFINARIEGDIEGLVINGVEVEPLVRAERERRYPELVVLRADDPAGLAQAWRIVTDGWARTVARARALSPERLDERVDGEWSFVETLRHLIMATDIWHGRMIRGESAPYHPWGMAGSFLEDPVALGLDYGARPSLDDVLAVRATRTAAVGETIASATVESLARVCVPPPPPGHPDQPHTVLECLHVILNEEFEHRLYAERDLAILEAGSGGGAPAGEGVADGPPGAGDRDG